MKVILVLQNSVVYGKRPFKCTAWLKTNKQNQEKKCVWKDSIFGVHSTEKVLFDNSTSDFKPLFYCNVTYIDNILVRIWVCALNWATWTTGGADIHDTRSTYFSKHLSLKFYDEWGQFCERIVGI